KLALSCQLSALRSRRLGALTSLLSKLTATRWRRDPSLKGAQDLGRRLPRAKGARSRLLNASTCRFRLQPLHYKFSNSFDDSSRATGAQGRDNAQRGRGVHG